MSTTRDDRSQLHSLIVDNADFRNLLAGQAVSGFGDWVATVALMALVLNISGSSTAVGGVLVLRLAPAIVAGTAATRLVQKFEKRRTMLAMDATRIAIVALIPFVQALWWVYLWAFLLEAAGLIFLPARDAAIPELLRSPDDQLVRTANSLMLGSSYGTIPLGAGAFAVLSVFFGTSGWFSATSTALWLDAVTFVVSFLFIRRIGSLRNEGDHAPGAHHVRMLDAFRLPLVRALVAPAVVAAVGIGSLFSLGVVFVQHVLGANDTEFGVLVVMFGIGAALGLVVLRLARWKSIRVVRASLGVQGVVIAGMSCAPVIALVFVGALGFGGATAITLTSAITVLQERLDDQDRVEAFTTFHVLIRAGLGIAALAAGAAGDAISGVSWPFVGHLAPARVVLFASGVVVIATAALSGRWTKQIAKEPA